MKEINFIASGLLGDFIQSLYTIKNVCRQEHAIANLYLASGHGGDDWRFGPERAYNDLKSLISQQPYINKFELLQERPENFINLNDWRIRAANDFVNKGEYPTCWSELLSQEFHFSLPTNGYAWLTAPISAEFQGTVLVHRSYHRHSGFKWGEALQQLLPNHKVCFLTSNERDWVEFGFKVAGLEPLFVDTIEQMATALNSCKYFIGNQSAPFSLACALDKPRLGELEAGVWKFYKDEIKYTNNMSYYLSNEQKHYTDNALIKI